MHAPNLPIPNLPIFRALAILAAVLPLPACERSADFDYYMLALSWEPAFCARNAGKPECRALDADDFAATHLVLHGLWPNATDGAEPAYCAAAAGDRDVDDAGSWCDLPAPGMDQQTRADLARLMPGSASCLERHEWLKHGTCSTLAPDAYFDVSLQLVEDFQATKLAAALQRGVGKDVPLARLIDAFEAEFGAGAAAALTLTCRRNGGRAYLAEIRLALRPAALGKPLSGNSLYLDDPGPKSGCPGNVVIDRVGSG